LALLNLLKFLVAQPSAIGDVVNQRHCFDQIAKKLGIDPTQPDQWHAVARSDIERRGGRGILHFYGRSLSRALQCIYPEHATSLPIGRPVWKSKETQREFFEKIAKELGVDTSKPEQWKAIKVSDILARGGFSVLSHHRGSFSNAIRALYPEHNLKPRPRWQVKEVQKKYFDAFAEARNLDPSSTADWYKVQTTHVLKDGGAVILRHYKGCLSKALETLYPELDWQPWKFVGGVPKRFWRSVSNVEKYMRWLETELNVVTLDDWYKVSNDQIKKKSGMYCGTRGVSHSKVGGKLLTQFGSLCDILQKIYPTHSWDTKNFSKRGSKWGKSQWQLLKIVEQHFEGSGMEVLFNYQHPQLLFSSSSQRMELDIFVPAVSLALEYQGSDFLCLCLID
jgi:hypothetical protein